MISCWQASAKSGFIEKFCALSTRMTCEAGSCPVQRLLNYVLSLDHGIDTSAYNQHELPRVVRCSSPRSPMGEWQNCCMHGDRELQNTHTHITSCPLLSTFCACRYRAHEALMSAMSCLRPETCAKVAASLASCLAVACENMANQDR